MPARLGCIGRHRRLRITEDARMTRQQQNQGNDQKKGSADLRSTGERAGMPGQAIADGQSPDALASRTSDQAASSRDEASASTDSGTTIPAQTGCGPNVTDYPGLSDKTRQ
jgi:hypothetical protein